MKLKDLTLEKDFDIKIISLVRGKKSMNAIGISIMEYRVANEFTENLILDKNDQLVCYGSYKNFMSLWKTI
jgi:trk system potassium uptake protein TrkA